MFAPTFAPFFLLHVSMSYPLEAAAVACSSEVFNHARALYRRARAAYLTFEERHETIAMLLPAAALVCGLFAGILLGDVSETLLYGDDIFVPREILRMIEK